MNVAEILNSTEELQKKVNNSVNRLKDNRLCVAGDKSKVLIVGTKQLKRTRLKNKLATGDNKN